MENTEARIEELKVKIDSLVDKPFILLLISEQPDPENLGESVLGADLVATVPQSTVKETLRNFLDQLS